MSERLDVSGVVAEYLTYILPNIFLVILISVNMVLMFILGGKGVIVGTLAQHRKLPRFLNWD